MKSLNLSQPHAIIVVGIPGSGKTFFAEKFSRTFNTPYINWHKLVDFGVDDPVAISGIADYQIDETLKTLQSLVVEVPTETRTARLELAKKARQAGYNPLIVWVQTDRATSKQRSLKAKQFSSGSEYDQHLKHFTPPNQAEKPVVISGKHTYASQAKVVLTKLSEERASITGQGSSPLVVERNHNNKTIR